MPEHSCLSSDSPLPLYAGVVVEAPLTTVFHYSVPEALRERIRPGDRALIPFGNRRTRGVVVSLAAEPPIDPARIRELLSISPPEERVPEDLLRLAQWVAEYYNSGWGTVLAAAVPAAVKQGRRERVAKNVVLRGTPEEAAAQAVAVGKRAPKQAEALRAVARWFEAHPDLPLAADNPALAEAAPAAALRQLAAKGLLRLEEGEAKTPEAFPEAARELVLSEEQRRAVDAVADALRRGGFTS